MSNNIPTPIYREECYLAKHAGMDVVLPDPVTRKDAYLKAIAENSGNVAANLPSSEAADVSGLKDDLNALILALKDAGLMTPDEWEIDVKTAPNLPIAETAANSGHATFSFEDNVITITLDEKVEDLEDSDHGSTWGVHKWIGFGVDTGLDTIKGVVFSDGTAEVTLGDDDIGEATSVGLSAGDFVLYIKAEKILAEGGKFSLKAPGHEKVEIQMVIVEGEADLELPKKCQLNKHRLQRA